MKNITNNLESKLLSIILSIILYKSFDSIDRKLLMTTSEIMVLEVLQNIFLQVILKIELNVLFIMILSLIYRNINNGVPQGFVSFIF